MRSSAAGYARRLARKLNPDTAVSGLAVSGLAENAASRTPGQREPPEGRMGQ